MPKDVSKGVMVFSSMILSTAYVLTPRVDVDRRIISVISSVFSPEHRQKSVRAGLDFFIVMGENQTSIAPASKRDSITVSKFWGFISSMFVSIIMATSCLNFGDPA